MASTKTILEWALGELGVSEMQGDAHNKKILNYAKEAGFKWVGDDETPWCSIFMNWCCLKANLPRSKRADARSWLRVGKPVTDPEPGDVVIFWRGSKESWQGHVGLFIGFSGNGSSIFCLGGNQKDSVSIARYDRGRLLGFRRVEDAELDLPKPLLKKGDRGLEVKKLQKILREFNYKVGAIDGIFGTMTHNAMTEFQKSLGIQKPKGAFDQATCDKIKGFIVEHLPQQDEQKPH